MVTWHGKINTKQVTLDIKDAKRAFKVQEIETSQTKKEASSNPTHVDTFKFTMRLSKQQAKKNTGK